MRLLIAALFIASLFANPLYASTDCCRSMKNMDCHDIVKCCGDLSCSKYETSADLKLLPQAIMASLTEDDASIAPAPSPHYQADAPERPPKKQE